MIGNSNWQPRAPAERYRTIDIIRGLALFGVLMVNLLTGFRVPLLEYIRSPYAEPGLLNGLVGLLVACALEFKAFTIFSFLFGVGIAIQAERAAARKVDARAFLLRRLLWLFIFGTVHLFLIWNGDILTLYAVCGLLLLPLLGASWPVLFVAGTALIAFPEIVSFGLPLPSGPAALADIAQAHRVYGTGGFLAIQKFRWYEAWSLIVPLLIGVLPRTAGLMYCGMGAWRAGILREPERYRGKLAAILVAGTALGAPLTINEQWAKWTGHKLWVAFQIAHVDASILLGMAYIAGVLLWLTPRRALLLPGLAAIGQMALTNYLVQSIVFGLIFYGYGFGLFGRIGSAAAVFLGLTLYVAQVQLSRLWLRRFRFGPFEWLWRSLSYQQRQPMLRVPDGGWAGVGT